MTEYDYNTTVCSYGTSHNNSTDKEGNKMSSVVVKLKDPATTPCLMNFDNMEKLVSDLRRIAPSIDWDHPLRSGIVITFEKRDEHKMEEVKKLADTLGYII